MAMVMKVMAMMGCTNQLLRKNDKVHESYGKDGVPTIAINKNGNGNEELCQ